MRTRWKIINWNDDKAAAGVGKVGVYLGGLILRCEKNPGLTSQKPSTTFGGEDEEGKRHQRARCDAKRLNFFGVPIVA